MASIGIIRKMVEREIDSVKDLYKQQNKKEKKEREKRYGEMNMRRPT